MQSINKNLKTFIFYFVKQSKWSFLAMACCRISYVLDQLLVPYVFRIIVGRLRETSTHREAIWIKIALPFSVLLIVLLLVEILFRLYDYLKIKTIPLFEAHIRMWSLRHLNAQSYPFFMEHFSGDLAKRVNDLTDGASEIIIILISSCLPVFCTMVMGTFSFFCIHPAFGLLLISCLGLHIVVTYLFYSYKCRDGLMLHAEKVSQLCGAIVDSFANILTIQLFARKNKAIERLIAPQREEVKAHKKTLWMIFSLHTILSGISIAFIGVGLLFFMIYYWQKGKLTIEDVTYIFFTGNNICNSLWDSLADLPDFFEKIGYGKQALKVIQQEPTRVDLPTTPALRCTAGVIEFKEVYFSYLPEHPIFERQSIYVGAGEKVGLIGLSGSGKSTFAHLLLRFFEPQKGSIYIDYQDINSVTQDSLRAAISLIPQDTTLFHDTILENIRYGRKEATDKEVIAAAQNAKCHDFIMGLSEGYHTLVGERGSKLSGGQRQRIAIARAMLKNAPILILDEATSALDLIIEKEIQEILATAMVGKTTIVITHRLSILSTMDRILLFDKGKVIAQGPHEVLINLSPLYAAMCQL